MESGNKERGWLCAPLSHFNLIDVQVLTSLNITQSQVGMGERRDSGCECTGSCSRRPAHRRLRSNGTSPNIAQSHVAMGEWWGSGCEYTGSCSHGTGHRWLRSNSASPNVAQSHVAIDEWRGSGCEYTGSCSPRPAHGRLRSNGRFLADQSYSSLPEWLSTPL